MKRRVWTVSVGIAVLVAVAIVVALRPSEKPFYDYVAERKAAGLPTSFAELSPKPPDEENCGPELAAAFQALLDRYGPSDKWSGSSFDPNASSPDDATPEQTAALAALALRMRPGLDRLAAALAKPKLWMPPKTDALGFVTSGRVPLVQNVSRVLAIPAGSESDPSRRLTGCRAQFVLAERTWQGSLIDWIVSVAVANGAVHSLRRGVEAGTIDPAEAQRAIGPLLTRSLATEFLAVSRADPACIIEMYDAVLQGRVVPTSTKRPFWTRIQRLFKGSGHVLIDLDIEPGMADRVVEACREYETLANVDPSRFATSESVRELLATPELQSDLMAIMLPKLTQHILRAEAAQRLARIALAAAVSRAANGAYPATLDELRSALGGEVPIDPFSGTVFVYEPTPEGLTISSASHAPPDAAEPNTRDLLIWELKR